jgi:hypothetical protein
VFVTQNINKEESIFHYLTEGDVFNKNTGEVKFANFKKPCPPSEQRPTSSNNIFGVNVFKNKAIELIKYKESVELDNYQGTNPVVKVSLKR